MKRTQSIGTNAHAYIIQAHAYMASVDGACGCMCVSV